MRVMRVCLGFNVDFILLIPCFRYPYDHSLIKVFIPSYVWALNSKTNKMAGLDLYSENMFDWSSKSFKIFRKIG
jgi:hypothetical protein